MRVLVTGIDGFVGRHLAAALAAAGHSVSGTTLLTNSTAGPDPVFQMDVRDADAVFRTLDEAEVEAVIHLAGRASVAGSFEDPVATYEVNAGGAIHILEACRRTGVGRVLMISSCEVYGSLDPAAGPATEDRSMAPVSPYGGSKAVMELIGDQYFRTFGLPVLEGRSFPHTGPGQREPYLFPSVARQIAEAEAGLGPKTVKVGNVEVVRDVLDVRDVVGAYLLLMERGRPGEVYNVCGGRGRSLRKLLTEMCGMARRAVDLEVDPSRKRAADIAWMVGDPEKIRSETGWRPRIEWKETANDLLEEARARVAAGTEREVGSDATRA